MLHAAAPRSDVRPRRICSVHVVRPTARIPVERRRREASSAGLDVLAMRGWAGAGGVTEDLRAGILLRAAMLIAIVRSGGTLSVRALAERFGRTTRVIDEHLDRLRELTLIERRPGVPARAIRS